MLWAKTLKNLANFFKNNLPNCTKKLHNTNDSIAYLTSGSMVVVGAAVAEDNSLVTQTFLTTWHLFN